ncbi:hypothetical protein COCNU_02G008330 [Cocos nucifera]|uniref:Uncharacterized protein n=1 Tax=Cocos nucifera TaxID=13894 RepID=A0A8K0HZ69_COCNU|nr:hypothetical protein COCNU_02G008330 [Cocos nucifera]
MEREEKRRLQPSGFLLLHVRLVFFGFFLVSRFLERHERVVCHKCGWVYPNPHPSAKQRRAHRKHCGTTGGDGGAVTAGGGGAGGGEEKKASYEELSDEDRRKNSADGVFGTEILMLTGEAVVEDLKLVVEEGKEVKGGVGSGGEFRESGKDAILETNNSDNTLEPYVLLHGSQVPGPGTECSANQLESDKRFGDHTLSCDDVSCNINMDSASKHAENSDSLELIKAFMVASEEKQDFACAESKVNGTMFVNDTELGYLAKNDSDEEMPVCPTLLGNPASDSSVRDSQLQKMDVYVAFDDPLDHATVNTLMKVYPDEVSAHIEEAKSIACNTQDEQSNKEGQLSQNELSSKAGSCLMKNNDGEYLNSTTYCDQSECQNGKPYKWKMSGNELENVNALQIPSSTSQGEILEELLGFYEDHGYVELDVTVMSAGAGAGNELNYHVGDVASEIVRMVELDNIANGIPSTIQVPESNPPSEEIVNINAVNKLNSDQSHKDEHVNGDRSILVSDSEQEAGVSLAKSEGSEGLGSDGLETHPCVTTAGTSGAHAVTVDDQVTGSHETHAASIQSGEVETEFQSTEQSDPSHELLLCDHMLAGEVGGFALSEVSQADVTTKISNENQLVIDEATVANNPYSSVELKQKPYEEESCHSTKTNPRHTYNTVEPEPLPDENIGENEVEKSEDFSAPSLFDNGLDFQHNEKNSRHLENITEDHLDQPEHQKVLHIISTENTVGDDTDDPDMKTKLKNAHINTENNLMEELHQLNDHKVQTEHVENIPGSQLEPQNGFQDNSKDSSVGNDNNDNNYSIPEIGFQIPHVKTENGLAKPSSEDPECEKKNSHAQDFMLVGQVTSSSSMGSIKNLITCDKLEMNSISRVSSDPCCQPLKEEHVNFEPKQHPDSYIWDTVISADSNGQTDGVEQLRGSVSDGTVPSIRHKTCRGSILDPQTQTPKDLCSSNLAKEFALPECSATDCVIFEEPPFMSHAKPDRPSVSYEIQSMQNSQDDSEARKKDEVTTAKFARGNSRKVHVPLKVLLAEANFENQQVTNAQGRYKPMQDKTNQTSQDEGCAGKAWSSKLASEKPTEPSLGREEYTEWNSPASFPVKKNQRRRDKGRQAWMPFICCPSIQ